MRASRAGRLAEGQRCAIRASSFPKSFATAVHHVPKAARRESYSQLRRTTLYLASSSQNSRRSAADVSAAS
eukprot:4090469-Prymnesium_polylepis.1